MTSADRAFAFLSMLVGEINVETCLENIVDNVQDVEHGRWQPTCKPTMSSEHVGSRRWIVFTAEHVILNRTLWDIQPSSYFAVIIEVLQPFDSHISDVTSAKQDFTWGKTEHCQLNMPIQEHIQITQSKCKIIKSSTRLFSANFFF